MPEKAGTYLKAYGESNPEENKVEPEARDAANIIRAAIDMGGLIIDGVTYTLDGKGHLIPSEGVEKPKAKAKAKPKVKEVIEPQEQE